MYHCCGVATPYREGERAYLVNGEEVGRHLKGHGITLSMHQMGSLAAVLRSSLPASASERLSFATADAAIFERRKVAGLLFVPSDPAQAAALAERHAIRDVTNLYIQETLSRLTPPAEPQPPEEPETEIPFGLTLINRSKINNGVMLKFRKAFEQAVAAGDVPATLTLGPVVLRAVLVN